MKPAKRWGAWVLTALPVLFLTFDTVIHLMNVAQVRTGFAELGYPDIARPLGLVEVVCLALYVLPRTTILGAILWTGYLGGAMATHVRVGNPLFSHVLFPIYIALPMWAGLYLRDPRLRELIPLRRPVAEA